MNEDSGCVRTKLGIVILACVLVGIGVMWGMNARPNTHYGGYYGDLELLYMINIGLAECALCVSFVGLIALLSGVHLWRSLSFAFAIFLATMITGLADVFTDFLIWKRGRICVRWSALE